MTKNLWIVLLIILVLAGGYFFSHNSSPSHESSTPAGIVPDGATVVTLTKEGFSPDELTVQKDETIYFNTTTGSMFWPASNLHPSHQIYSEFDPMEPLQPGDTWSFTFTKVGKWEFHDHLAPYFTGVITVTE